MRLAVERLRWGLLAGALLLIVVLVGLVSYGRYRAVKTWRRLVARSGATITHETSGFTYSQAVKGRTIFTLHAAKAVPEGDGKYSLQDAVLVLYDRAGAPTDRIYGAEFEYDQKAGVAKAMGEVHMDLQPPAALSSATKGNAPANGAAATNLFKENIETPQTIHVSTSGLVFVRKLGVAATSQEVEIAYQGLRGSARGAEFDAGESVVHLLAAVRVEESLRGRSAVLTATKADLDRASNVIRLTQPEAVSGDRTASAAAAVLNVGKDGSLERVHATGGVTLKAGTQRMTAPVLEAVMSAGSLLQRAVFSGGVRFEDSDTARPMQGTAQAITIGCDRAGSPSSVLAEGQVAMSMQVRAADGEVLHRAMGAERAMFALQRPRRGVGRRRSAQVSMVEASGAAWVRGESFVGRAGKTAAHPGVKTTEMAADDLRLRLTPDAAGKDQLRSLTGAGHTRLLQTMPDGSEQSSTGDAMQVQFATRPKSAAGAVAGSSAEKVGAAGLQVVSAEQKGHIRLRSQPAVRLGAKGAAEVSTGSAERVEFDGARNRVTLYGQPQLERGDTEVSAQTIVLDESSGDAAAHGGVVASFVNAGARMGSPVTHVVAADAFLHHAAETIEFRGTDAQPARLWQGASQLEAASVLLDRAQDTLAARPAAAGGRVHAVFASSGRAAATTGKLGAGGSNGRRRQPGLQGLDEENRVVRIESARMDYSGGSRTAVFAGQVRMEGGAGTVQAARGVVFLSPAAPSRAAARRIAASAVRAPGEPDPVGGAVEKIVLSGNVRLEQPGRRGTGEQLLYTATSGEFVLTGSPGHRPRVVDEKQGSLTGATLLFRLADSTIIVAGEPGARGRARGRVHTETEVR